MTFDERANKVVLYVPGSADTGVVVSTARSVPPHPRSTDVTRIDVIHQLGRLFQVLHVSNGTILRVDCNRSCLLLYKMTVSEQMKLLQTAKSDTFDCLDVPLFPYLEGAKRVVNQDSRQFVEHCLQNAGI